MTIYISVKALQRYSCFYYFGRSELYYRICINYNFSKNYCKNACYFADNNYLC